MAVSVNDRYIRATATASQTVFTYDFPIAATSDITILKVAASDGAVTTLVYSTDYTLTGVGNDAGGTFVLTSGATVNDIYVAYGNTPYARATDFTGATEVTTDALNTDYNEEEKQIQQNNRDISRCIRIPLSDNISTLDNELPPVEDRKGKYLYFDDTTGDATVSVGTSESSPAGGSDTELQYNNAGDLDGISGWKTPDGTGTVNATGQFNIDNIRLDGNTISSTNTDGNVTITPDGDGVTDFSTATTALWFPVGTTAQRPGTPSAGYCRYNSTLNVLETWNGSTWVAQSGGAGDVEGPGSSTDNAIARFDGTGGTLLQDSSVLISDTDVVSGITQLNVDNVRIDGNSITSTDTAGDLILTPDTTGDLILDGVKWPQTPGANQYILISDGVDQATWSPAPSGGIIKLIQTVDVTNRSTSSTSLVSSGISASLTPFTTSSLVRIVCSGVGGASTQASIRLTIFRDTGSGATDITPAGVNYMSAQILSSSADLLTFSFDFIDTPNTTNNTTYYLYFSAGNGTVYLGRRGTDTVFDLPTTITLEEVQP